MGRHASGKNNYALSGRAVAALVAVLVLVAGLVVYLATRGDRAAQDSASPATNCVAGDLDLPVAASDDAIGQSLVDAYSDANPVVRDFCVRPSLVDSIADAAVYIAPNTPVAHQQLAQRNRTASTAEPAPVLSVRVGVAGASVPASAADIELESVAFPVDEEPAASALVASTIAGSDQDAVNALTNQRVAAIADAGNSPLVATSEDNVPDGYSFVPVDASVLYTAIPLNQGEKVTEDQSRAGQDFARVLSERFQDGGVDQPAISDLVWAAATPTGGETITDHTETGATVADGGPVNTLFLLDTSEAMAPYLDSAAAGIASAAEAVADTGHQVALWNYSSPLNPGVTKGYRRNVAFTPDAGEVVQTVNRFLTGGKPQTREAVTAAVQQVAETGTPARVVVVTTGTADGGDDGTFAGAVSEAAGAGVTVSVVHVGEGQQDQALRGASSSAADAARPDQVATSIEAAAGISR
ncbi:VWA domain-containing protein [Corynebacterium qintianiae]|uniref:VWA domain-containing protein n=1 Tax=Corynebacterium qintianiae TaxID=2709392 RepID=UPI0013EAAC49|nr:VWA domain-containing protein [Corynebacterium qintianiae]